MPGAVDISDDWLFGLGSSVPADCILPAADSQQVRCPLISLCPPLKVGGTTFDLIVNGLKAASIIPKCLSLSRLAALQCLSGNGKQ